MWKVLKTEVARGKRKAGGGRWQVKVEGGRWKVKKPKMELQGGKPKMKGRKMDDGRRSDEHGRWNVKEMNDSRMAWDEEHRSLVSEMAILYMFGRKPA